MSDYLSPILFVMEDESEAFWCFVALMERLGPNFNRDQNGMHTQLFALSKVYKIFLTARLQFTFAFLLSISIQYQFWGFSSSFSLSHSWWSCSIVRCMNTSSRMTAWITSSVSAGSWFSLKGLFLILRLFKNIWITVRSQFACEWREVSVLFSHF